MNTPTYMRDDVREKLEALHYNGSAEELYEMLRKHFAKICTKAPELVDIFFERLTTEDFEEIIQLEIC